MPNLASWIRPKDEKWFRPIFERFPTVRICNACHAEAIGCHVAGQELHRVIDREPGGHRAARRIDIDADVFLAVFHLQKKQLSDDQVGDVVVNRCADKDDPVFQQTGLDVITPLAPAGLLDHHRDEDGLREIIARFGHDFILAEHWPPLVPESFGR